MTRYRVPALSGFAGANPIDRPSCIHLPLTDGEIEMNGFASARTTPSWSNVISMPVSRGTRVLSLPGIVPTTWRGATAWTAHAAVTMPPGSRSENR